MRITIQGYKSIYSPVSININGLTLLSGANSSGKSSFMQPLLLLKQTIESDFDTGALLLDGGNVKLADSSEILSKVPEKKVTSFSIRAQTDKEEVQITYGKNRQYGLMPTRLKARNKKFSKGISLRMGMSHDQIASQIPPDSNPFADLLEKKETQVEWKVIRRKCFIDAMMSTSNANDSIFPLKIGLSPAVMLEDFIQNLIHVPGVRGNPERSYRVASDTGVYAGSFEPYVASIIHHWRSSTKHRRKHEQLVEDLKELGLASSIETTRINDTRLEVKVSRYRGAKSSDCVNIADVGFGVSQTLPVLVALQAANKGQFVYIEQPELHLHPKAQHKLSGIIARAIKNGVLIIIETHSSILLRGIQTIVAKKEISPEKISLNWFTQSKETGETQVNEAQLDNLGAFGPWPSDFEEVGLLAESQYLDAVEEALNDNS